MSGGGQVGGQVFGHCCLGGEAVSGRVWGCRRSRCAARVSWVKGVSTTLGFWFRVGLGFGN